ICHQAEQSMVMLGKTIETGFGIMVTFNYADRNLSACIVGSTVIRGDGHICGATFKSRAIEVKQWRHGEDYTGVNGMNPGKIAEHILFALAVTDACVLRVRIVRHLVEIRARRSGKPQLIVGCSVENQRSEHSAAAGPIMKNFAGGSLQAVISTVAAQAEVIRRTVTVVAKT